MSRDALTRLFPDGKTVFVPADGQPMPGYEQARAEIELRGGAVQVANANSGGLFGWLFGGPRGGGADDAEEGGGEVVSGRGGRMSRPGSAGTRSRPQAATFRAARPLRRPRRPTRRPHPRRGPAGAAQPWSPLPPPIARPPKSRSRRPRSLSPGLPRRPSPRPRRLLRSRWPRWRRIRQATPALFRCADLIAAKFIAPLPPRKPSDLSQTPLLQAPIPPVRPQEFEVASEDAKSAGLPVSAKKDLIAAMLQRGKLPGVITQGVSAAPPSALALADPGAAPAPPARPALLDRAAALNAPLPPPRPARDASSGVSAAPKSAPPPPAPGHSAPNVHGANPAAPYGGLVLDAFNVQPKALSPVFASELRGSTP